MDLASVIIGPVVTEKSERLKTAKVHIYTLRVAPSATKLDVKNALRVFYNANARKVRIIHTQPKTRLIGSGGTMEKRHAFKKALVTLDKDSKPLDLAAFQTIPS